MSPLRAAGVLWLLLASAAGYPGGSRHQSGGHVCQHTLPDILQSLGRLGQLTELVHGLGPVCERHPKPLQTPPYEEPTQRACARSCLQLRDQGGSPPDGVYWLSGMPVPVLCDFSLDGGGWTLLLTAASRGDWDPLSVLGYAQRAPSLSADYSILGRADAIRDLGTGTHFAYRIEAQAETGRQRWGGVWWAPRHYSFTHQAPSQTDVVLARRFDNWEYKDAGIERRMPWLSTELKDGVLTTSESASIEWWGTLVSIKTHSYYKHSPWINTDAENSGTVLYWMREEIA